MSIIVPDLVKRFLNWKQGDEEESWRNKAVEVLIKRLKRQPNEQYSSLQQALHRKSEETPCITLSRSQDGRLQVSHRKMLPHVMYCRIFRWPDLQSHHELRSVPNCLFPAHTREASKICINPYHYSRVDHSVYPPVVTPRRNELVDASPPPQSPLSPGSNYTPQPQNSPAYYTNHAQQITPVSSQSVTHHNPFSNSLNPGSPNGPISFANTNLNHHQQQAQALPISFNQNQSPNYDVNWFAASNGASNADMNAESPQTVVQFDSQSSPPPGYTGRDQFIVEEHNNHNMSPDEGREHWCRITYAELNQKIGEPFKGSSSEVIVDGFTNPTAHINRFSLGVLSNINRNSTIEMTRRAIRKGVRLENIQDSQIFVKNLSESSIFFHSKNCNVENQLNQHAVVKIEPEGRHKIFDQKVFENLIYEILHSQDRDKSYERLFSLTDHCIIKMSFVKGWGSIYQRQDVTSTPCWIEIHLLKPYALIDQYLRTVRPPTTQITSTS